MSKFSKQKHSNDAKETGLKNQILASVTATDVFPKKLYGAKHGRPIGPVPKLKSDIAQSNGVVRDSYNSSDRQQRSLS